MAAPDRRPRYCPLAPALVAVFLAAMMSVSAALGADSGQVRVSFGASPTDPPATIAVVTNTPTAGVRVPVGPAVDNGSVGSNVRARTDQRGSDSIPKAEPATTTASPTAPGTVPRLNDPVLRWLPEIMASSTKWGVPPEILAGIIRIESQGEPGPISPAGARGLVQMMPDGLMSYGAPESLWHDPTTNIDAGAWGLAWRFAAQGSWAGAVGAYLGFGCDIYGTCTDVYVKAVLGWADYYRPLIADPLHAGFALLPADWAYGPIRIFQMPNPPTPEPPPNTHTPSPTGTPSATKTPKAGEPTKAPTEAPNSTATAVVPTTQAPTNVPPTAVPTVAPTEVPPTAVPTEPPPPPTPVPTEPPPPPPPTDVPPTAEP
jgi:hypothetical protein